MKAKSKKLRHAQMAERYFTQLRQASDTSLLSEAICNIRVKQTVTLNAVVESRGDAIDLLRSAFDLAALFGCDFEIPRALQALFATNGRETGRASKKTLILMVELQN